MRKILTSVLSVAGLLAVVLALAASPASAAKVVVTVQTPAVGDTDASTDEPSAGTYTVSWETQGGCDPGSGTSGASGSVTLTVAKTAVAAVETGIVTDNICNYTYKATFTNPDGAACVVGGTGTTGTTAGPLAVNTDGDLALLIGTCASTAKVYVTVEAAGVNVGDCIADADDTDDVNAAGANVAGADNCDLDNDATTTGTVAGLPAGADDGSKVAVAADVTDARSVGAASATTFTITATPQPPTPGGKVPEGCNAVSEDTETDYDDKNLQKATLTVVNNALGGADCSYTVSAALPAGFAAGDGSARSTGNQQKNVNPAVATGGPDGDADTTGDNDTPFARPAALEVSVASVKVYLVQNVIGDAGGASAEYKYTAPCGAPGLPGALERTPASGGITSVEGKTVVELRTGRFNISEALPSGTAADGTAAHALDAKGKACEATIAASGIPASCSVSHNSPASLATGDDSVIIEITIDCSPPPAPEPPAEEPMDDMGGDDMGADDMGADDMGADDMGSDDMGSDDMGDMGPPEDTPTG